MLNQTLREKIQAIKASTKSKEVKALCETLLSKKVITQQDANIVFEKENPVLNATKSLNEAQMANSKNAAAALMANWNGGAKKTTHVGFNKKETIDISETQNVSEQMIAIGTMGSAAAKQINYDVYGVAEAVTTLLEKPIATRFTEVKYALNRFYRDLSQGVSESSMVRTFISTMKPFDWDADVNAAISKIETRVNEDGIKLDVLNTIEAIKSADKKMFFSKPVDLMQSFIFNESSLGGLSKNLQQWSFNTHVKQLLTNIALYESTNNNGSLSVANTFDGKAKEVHSPVHFAKGVKVFKAGKNYFGMTADTMFRLSQSQINALPKDFHDLDEALSKSFVTVSNEEVIVRVGDTKARITENGLYVGNSKVDRANFANSLAIIGNNTLNRINESVKTALLLADKFNNIYHIDNAKHIVSNVYEGFECFVFRVGNSVFVNKINESMKLNKFVTIGASSAIKYVKENFGVEISTGLTDIITESHKRKLQNKEVINNINSTITVLESNIEKLNNALSSIGNDDELVTAKTILEGQLKTARNEWNRIIKEEEETEEETEVEDIEVDMDQDFDVEVEKTGSNTFKLTVNKSQAVETEEEETEEEETEEVEEETEEVEEETEEVEEETEEAEEETEEEEEDLENLKELGESELALDLNTAVKLKGEEKQGTITGINGDSFVVTWEDGSSSEHTSNMLSAVDVEMDAAKIENLDAADDENQAMGEDENADIETMVDTDVNTDDVDDSEFIDVKLNQDSGPYTAGTIVKVSAAEFTAAGEDDILMVKDAVAGGESVSKKVLDAADLGAADSSADIKSRLDALQAELSAIQQLATDGGMNINIDNVLSDVQNIISTLDTPGASVDDSPVDADSVILVTGDQSIEVPSDAEVNVNIIDADGEAVQGDDNDEEIEDSIEAEDADNDEAEDADNDEAEDADNDEDADA